MARLLGISVKDVQKARKNIAKDTAAKYNIIVVLKGHKTIVASPKGKVYINTTGNPGMASAGCGDVLTGMIASFLGQGIEPFEAAKLGVYLHGLAGDLAAKEVGQASLTATDVLNNIPKVIKSL
jgi:NAD(P)H-hydrate epimerase